MIISETLQSYLDKHISASSEILAKVERQTWLNELQPHMISGLHQGIFLKMLVMARAAKSILEIGTYTGFSAIAMAEGLPEEGKLYTFEKDPEMAVKAQRNIDQSQQANKISILVGDAFLHLGTLFKEVNFDFVFIDADKSRNLDYYNLILPSLASGSIILIDNVLWKGKVYDPEIQDKTTESFRFLNDYIAADDRVLACILPVREGIWFIQKK